MPKAKISALGCYTPPRVLTNQDLEKLVDTNDQWIMERTGIRERHIADPEMATSDMAILAARCALAQRGIEATEIDAIIVCTVTPDHFFPSTACLVQNGIGAKGAWGFDLIAACSGFLYGLTVGAHLVAAGTHKKVLVIGSDTMSRIIDYTDRATCVLFGDGAGAMLIEPPVESLTTAPASSTSWARSMAPAATSSRCRRAAAAVPPPMRRSISASTSYTRKAPRSSSTPRAKCSKSAAIYWNAITSRWKTSAS